MNVYTPPGAPPVKKGLSLLAWVGIGCGVIILLGVIAMLVGGIFVSKKISEFKDNPAKAAEMILKMNPDIDVVSTDDKAGTITIRDKKTGDETTVSFDDIKNGKIAFKTKDGTASFDANSKDGTIKVTDDKGNVSQLGATSTENLPAWIPTYTNGESTGAFSATDSAEGKSGAFTVATTDSVDAVMSFYESKLKEAGFQVNKTSFPGGGHLAGTSDGDKRTLSVQVGTGDGKTTALVTYNDKP
jgi:hypothetical protein